MEREELLRCVLSNGLLKEYYPDLYPEELYEVIQDRIPDMKDIRTVLSMFALNVYSIRTREVYALLRYSQIWNTPEYSRRRLIYDNVAAEVEEAYRHSMDEPRLRMARERRGISNDV